MLYKTPEWQEVPKFVQFAVKKAQLPESLIDIDYFKKPPSRMPKEIPIYDRRGQVFEFISGRVIVTGYADGKVREKPIKLKNVRKPKDWAGDNFDPNKIKKTTFTLHSWWCMDIDNGLFARITSETINKWQKKCNVPNVTVRGVPLTKVKRSRRTLIKTKTPKPPTGGASL